MLVTSAARVHHLERGRLAPALSFVGFSLRDLLEGVRVSWFEDLPTPQGPYFVTDRHLACIAHRRGTATIFIHNVLNHPRTPRQVFTLICKHELIHLLVPSRMMDGKKKEHTSEFWEWERRIAPDRDAVWGWIWEQLWWCLKSTPEKEEMVVRRNWKQIWRDESAVQLLAPRPALFSAPLAAIKW